MHSALVLVDCASLIEILDFGGAIGRHCSIALRLSGYFFEGFGLLWWSAEELHCTLFIGCGGIKKPAGGAGFFWRGSCLGYFGDFYLGVVLAVAGEALDALLGFEF